MRVGAVLLLAAVLSGCAVVSGGSPPTDPIRAPGAAPSREVQRVGSTRPRLDFDEVRGLWVVRSTMTSESELLRMLDDAVAAGFNTLLVQVRGRADAFYASRWEPRGETLSPEGDFDPLRFVVAEAHRRGVAVHAWVNTHLVWGSAALPTSPNHLVNARPDWLAVPRELARELYATAPSDRRFAERLRRYAAENRGTVEGMFSSPSHPEVQERVYSVWMDLAEEYDLDGIHFDYVRFPSADFDFSRGALERFRKWVTPRLSPARQIELTEAAESDPLAWVEALPGPWGEFRRDQVTRLVRRIYHGVKARRPDMLVSAAVFADRDDAYRFRFQDWAAWLEEGIVDVAVPMAYTTDDDRFSSQIREVRRAAGADERVWAGIGAYLNTVDGTIAKIDRARDERAGGVVLFSYDWAANEGRGDAEAPFLMRVGSARFLGR